MLTVSFYVLVGVNRTKRREAHAAWLTLVTGKVSGACLLFGFLLLAGRTGSFLFGAWHVVGPGALHDVAYSLVVVGFAAETGDAVANARAKLVAKGCDLVVVNDVSKPGVGFDHETNEVVILDRDGGEEHVALTSKRAVADALLDSVARRLSQGA